MTKARSPVYPAIGLGDAIDRVKLVYEKDYTNKLPREVIARHMGYSGLSGRALGVISSCGKYGLLDGRSDETRVSPLAVAIIAHEPGSKERVDALQEAIAKVALFVEMDERSQGGKGSDQGLRAWLQTEGFIPSAADSAIRSYRESRALVEEESRPYTAISNLMKGHGPPVQNPSKGTDWAKAAETIGKPPPGMRHELDEPDGPPPPGMRRAVFTLVEGDVEIVFPELLSKESAADLNDYLKIWLRKLQRDSGLAGQRDDQTEPE